MAAFNGEQEDRSTSLATWCDILEPLGEGDDEAKEDCSVSPTAWCHILEALEEGDDEAPSPQ